MNKLKKLYYNIKYFFRNIFLFKHLLVHYREYNGGWAVETFIQKHLDLMLEFYQNENKCYQVDESRLKILDELKICKNMFVSAFDDMHYLRELPEASNKHLGARKDFFLYFENHYNNWWD